MKIDALANYLDCAGFNLLTVLDRAAIKAIPATEVCAWRAIMLIGNSGAKMWQQMPDEYLTREHPVDEYALETVTAALQRLLPDVDWQVLFPAAGVSVSCPPLQQLGAAAGWHHASPLGTGINDACGLWFAYRAAIGFTCELPPYGVMATESPCLTCVDQPCVRACPATALHYQRLPDMKSCATFRLQPDSRCVDTCVARVACPVARDRQYSNEQTAHHYLRSLPTLKSWLAQLDVI